MHSNEHRDYPPFDICSYHRCPCAPLEFDILRRVLTGPEKAVRRARVCQTAVRYLGDNDWLEHCQIIFPREKCICPADIERGIEFGVARQKIQIVRDHLERRPPPWHPRAKEAGIRNSANSLTEPYPLAFDLICKYV